MNLYTCLRLLCLLVATHVALATEDRGNSANHRRSPTNARGQRTIAYWTPERVASARYRDYQLMDDKGDRNLRGFRELQDAVADDAWEKSTHAVGRILFSMNGSNYICSVSQALPSLFCCFCKQVPTHNRFLIMRPLHRERLSRMLRPTGQSSLPPLIAPTTMMRRPLLQTFSSFQTRMVHPAVSPTSTATMIRSGAGRLPLQLSTRTGLPATG